MWTQILAVALIGVAFSLLAWMFYELEKESKLLKPLKVVLLKDEDLEKVKDRVKFLPGVGPVLVTEEKDLEKLKEARGKTD